MDHKLSAYQSLKVSSELKFCLSSLFCNTVFDTLRQEIILAKTMYFKKKELHFIYATFFFPVVTEGI